MIVLTKHFNIINYFDKKKYTSKDNFDTLNNYCVVIYTFRYQNK